MDTRQVQEHLRAIGWPITVDGSFGPKTFEAVADFQRGVSWINMLVDGQAGPQTQEQLRNSLAFGGACGPNFWFREFKCKHCGWIKVKRELVRGLVEYRARYGRTVIVSAYRCPVHNRAIGGASNSQHLYGNAVDVPGIASVGAVRNLRQFSGIGYQPSGLVTHVDVRHLGPNTTRGSVSNPTVWRY